MTTPPAGGGPVPRPRHPAAANLQHERDKYSDQGEYYYGERLPRLSRVRVHTQYLEDFPFNVIILFLGQSSLMSCLWLGRDKMLGNGFKAIAIYTNHKENVHMT